MLRLSLKDKRCLLSKKGECTINPINELTTEAHRLSSCARRAFLEGRIDDSKFYLGKLKRYLGEESVAEVYAECERRNDVIQDMGTD